MNCNKCGEEVFTIPSQYTKFCKDCGKIILKLDGINSTPPTLNIPQGINETTSFSIPNYQSAPQNNIHKVPEYVPENTAAGANRSLLIALLVLGIIVISTIAYVYVSGLNHEEAATEEATEVTTEVIADSTQTIPFINETTTEETDIITDIDGNKYSTVKIGDQIWMVENLRTSHYNDGTEIPEVSDNTDWGNLSYGASCYNTCYYNSTVTSKLYNWYAVNTGKLAPVGWHIPSHAEWIILINYLGGGNIAGSHLKSNENTWNSSGSYDDVFTDNSSLFSGLPDEYRPSGNDGFLAMGPSGYWWSSTESNSKFAINCWLNCQSNNAVIETHKKTDGLSVRCIKD